VLFTRSIFLFHPLLIPPNHARLDRFRFPRLVSIDFPFGPHLVRHGFSLSTFDTTLQ
jgi:hypothetical protein